ncbi:hypothetical protein NLG97_g4946 [Lecanicillium saksenae]|uniref:Uncharacterized protein n=1 Tax=Lecanicillium saksenae TaxID=468837 RepID=A0ACC1QX21_9HYPO|nr:hypothetical protein NLG97_g4946 [Lecanicillium saksenae]
MSSSSSQKESQELQDSASGSVATMQFSSEGDLADQQSLTVVTTPSVRPPAQLAEPYEDVVADDEIPTVWSDFFLEKKSGFVAAIAKLEQEHRESKIGTLRKKLSLKASESTTMTVDEALSRVSDLGSLGQEIGLLVKQFSQNHGQETGFLDRAIRRLLRGAARVQEFQNGISVALQATPGAIGCLPWGIMLLVIQFSCLYTQSAQALQNAMRILSETNEILPSLEGDVHLYHWSVELRKRLVSIFESYLELCITIIKFSTKFNHPLHRSRVSDTPNREIEALQQKISFDIEIFDREVSQVHRIHETQTGKRVLESTYGYAKASEERDLASLEAIDSLQDHVLRGNQAIIQRIEQYELPTRQHKSEVSLPVRTLAMIRNAGLKGREELLNELHRRLIQENDCTDLPATCCLKGRGGMGKTEAAVEFAYRHQDHWEAGIFWVAADTNQETELTRTFLDIGVALGIIYGDTFDDRDVFKVKQWLQDTGTIASLGRIWPSHTNAAGCAILVTSQLGISSHFVRRTIDIQDLTPDEGLEILLDDTEVSNLSRQDRDVALKIFIELGGCPLFLSLAREYRRNLQLSLTDYLAQVRGSSNIPLAACEAEEVSGDWRYTKAATKAFELSLRQVEQWAPEARQLLDMLAFMHEDVSEFILRNQPSKRLQANSTSESFESDRKYFENINRLSRAGLVKVMGGSNKRSIRIHRDIQRALQMELNQDSARMEAAFERALNHLRANFAEPSPLQIPSAVTSAALRLVLPHVLSVLTCFERAYPRLKHNMLFARLVIDVGGMDCYDRGLIKESYRLSTAVESILKPSQSQVTDNLLSDALVIQGLCTDFMALSKREEGLSIRQKCLDIRRRNFRMIPKNEVKLDDKIRLYNCYTDLVCSLQQMNDFDQVRGLLDECHQNYKEWGSESECAYEYSKYYNQMAYVRLYENESDEAVALARRGYELAELSASGTNYPWLYKFDYANLLWQHGEFRQRAFEELQVMVDEHSRVLSDSYSEILALGMEQNLGVMAFYLGELDLAGSKLRGLAERALQCEAWPQENVVRGNYYLSLVLKAQDPASQEALDMEREAIRQLMKFLEKDTRGMLETYGTNYPLLFDYLVHWEFRLNTPRRPKVSPPPRPTTSWWWACVLL